MAGRNETLERYHTALVSQTSPGDLELVSKRFRENHRIANNDPIVAQLARVFFFHAERAHGHLSAEEANRYVAKVVAGRETLEEVGT